MLPSPASKIPTLPGESGNNEQIKDAELYEIQGKAHPNQAPYKNFQKWMRFEAKASEKPQFT
jgi:hypothetical protein